MGLIFLDKLRYPLKKTHLWLHCGNLLVNRGICKLSGYEVELLQMKDNMLENRNEDRAGLNAVGQIVFEMATGFPMDYAEGIPLEPTKRRLTLAKKEKLRELHFDYLKMISKPEVLQLVQFLCDEDKCASLHVSIHHPFFDQIVRFETHEPNNTTITSVRTLLGSIPKEVKSKSGKHKDIPSPRTESDDDESYLERDRQFGQSSRV